MFTRKAHTSINRRIAERLRIAIVLLMILMLNGSAGCMANDADAAVSQTPAPMISSTTVLIPREPISLGTGESVVLGVTDAVRVAVAEPKVADVAVVTRSEVLLTGRAPGETTLHIWDKDGLRSVTVRVFENTTHVIKELKTRLGLPGVEPWVHQGTVVLEGTVNSAAEKQRAIQVAGAYGKVIDLLVIQLSAQPEAPSDNTQNAPVPPIDPAVKDAELRQKLEELHTLIGDPNVRLRMVNDVLVMDGSQESTHAQERSRRLAALYFTDVVDVTFVRGNSDQPDLAKQVATAIDRPGLVLRTAGNRIIMEGTLRDQNELNRALQIAGGYGKEVVNLVALTNPLQVAIKVHVLEIDRTGMGELGVTWGSMNRGVLDSNAFYVGELTMDWMLRRLALIGAKIQTLADNGHAKILAAPTLLALSGQTAQFLAGGEVPVAMPQGENKYIIEWKEYGVRLQMTPVVDNQGYVTVQLAPEVSTLDWANAIRVSTIALPALRTRRTQTQVRVENGATLVLGGLLNREESNQATKFPFLADLPVVGRLFRSEKFSNGDTELLFLVTPHVLQDGESLLPEHVVSSGAWEPDPKAEDSTAPSVLDMVPPSVKSQLP